MKKLLTIALCLVLTLSIALSAGCNNSVFNGNYTEVQADEVTTFAADLTEAGTDIDMGAGVKMDLSMDMSMGTALTGKAKMSFNAISKDGVLQMSGSMDSESKSGSNTSKQNVKIYYDNDTMYMNYGEMKMAMKMSIDDYLAQSTAGVTEIADLQAMIAEFGELDTGITFFMETTETTTKIKIEIVDVDMGDEGLIEKLVTYFVFDANKVLTAVKLEAKMTMPYYEETLADIDITMSMEAWSGSISLPSDLDTYVQD